MNGDWSTVESRARVHAALADPARLAMADMLSLGDLSPGELGVRLGLASNLVAHHVGILAAAGLVLRTRSEGDHRRVYLRMNRSLVRTPMLTSAPPPARRVVFVCTRNTARSQLAVALWRRRGSRIAARSAGTDPAAGIHPQTVSAARRHGLTLAEHGTAHIDNVRAAGDLVVVVCDAAYEQLPSTVDCLHWSVPDPVQAGTAAAFDAAVANLSTRVDHLAHALKNGNKNDSRRRRPQR